MLSSLSADGRFVGVLLVGQRFTPDDTHEGSMGPDVFIRDRTRGTTTGVSVASDEAQGNGESDEPSISAGGRVVAFSSFACNFATVDASGNPDVFVRDRRRGLTARVSVASNGAQANSFSGDPAISANGHFVRARA